MINIELDEYDRYTLFIVGCGGTGSQLLSPLMQLCNNTKSRINKIILCDADYIEDKNLNNQKFVAEDVGVNKAYAMSKRYGYLFDELDIEAYEEYITSVGQIKELLSFSGNVIIIGCVDNNATRKILHEYFIDEINKKNLIYIDSGNGTSKRSGQIVTGYKKYGTILLKSVGSIFEDIVNTEEKIEEVGTCMRISNETPQNLATNFYAASNIFNILANIIMLNKIMSNLTFFDADECKVYSR